jgi:hypothetical protein
MELRAGVGKTPLPRLTNRRATIRYFGKDHCVAWDGNIQFILSNEAPTLQAMAMMADNLQALAAACGTGTGCILIIHSEVSPPSEEVRQFIKLKLERSSMVAAAQVVLGKGFRGAAMRSMLSLLQLAIRPKFAMRIFGNVATAADWVVQAVEAQGLKPPSAIVLKATANELCSQFF